MNDILQLSSTSSNSDNKYCNFVFTYNLDKHDDASFVNDKFKDWLALYAKEYGFQLELGTTTNRRHVQGWFRTPVRKRPLTILNDFKEFLSSHGVDHAAIDDEGRTWDRHMLSDYFTVRPMQGSVDQSIAYCSKSETKIGDYITNVFKYDGNDIAFLEEPERRYPWQQTVLEEIFESDESTIKDANDRKINWIYDPEGGTGKSLFVKYLCFNHPSICKFPFGTANQLRSGVISAGQRRVYLIDIPRTKGEDDSFSSLFSALEDLKNGFVVSAMYGKYEYINIQPPHVFIFSNQEPPLNLLSLDRWAVHRMMDDKSIFTYIGKPAGAKDEILWDPWFDSLADDTDE